MIQSKRKLIHWPYWFDIVRPLRLIVQWISLQFNNGSDASHSQPQDPWNVLSVCLCAPTSSNFKVMKWNGKESIDIYFHTANRCWHRCVLCDQWLLAVCIDLRWWWHDTSVCWRDFSRYQRSTSIRCATIGLARSNSNDVKRFNGNITVVTLSTLHFTFSWMPSNSRHPMEMARCRSFG